MSKSSTPSAKNLMLGAGKVFFDRWDANGNPTGLRHLGNVPKFELKTEADKIVKKQSMYAAKTTYLEVVKEINVTGDVTLEEFVPENLAMALLGTEGLHTQAALTVTNEVHVVSPGRVIQLKGYNVSSIAASPTVAIPAVVGPVVGEGTPLGDGTVAVGGTYTGTIADTYYVIIKTSTATPGSITGCTYAWRRGLSGVESAPIVATGSPIAMEAGLTLDLDVTTGQELVAADVYKFTVTPAVSSYVAGVDYIVEPSMLRSGLVTIPQYTTIPNGASIKFGYTQPAGSYPTIAAAVEGSIEGYMLFAGDPTKGPAYNADLWHVTITPNSSIAFIGEELASFDVTITVMDDRENHPTEPLHRLIKLT